MKPRYIMVGGFLGAGKTTALLQAGRRFTAAGLRVGLITNDQSGGLVDTALVRSRDLPVEEIAGGCFCCRFNSLVTAAERLDAANRPDVFLAEPVGSCTDLQATVSTPLRHMYGDRYVIAPLSVLVDPVRALRVLGCEPGRSFSPKVLYVYRKQLEEAELLVINKIDTVDESRRARLRDALARTSPAARILEISARTGEGVDEWLQEAMATEGSGAGLDIDYDQYADGEALLGWLNCTARLARADVDGDDLVVAVATNIGGELAVAGIELAHLKITLTPDDGPGIAVVNQVQTGTPPHLAFSLDARLDAGELTVNLRAEGDPPQLEALVRRTLAREAEQRTMSLTVEHLEAFRPSRPVPTYRFASEGGTDRRAAGG